MAERLLKAGRSVELRASKVYERNDLMEFEQIDKPRF